ncbi:unnamed protein product [Adineta steineri]|uniref:Uncharacterized protein n=1 Tax=Adineta steineri TaxID=433720 RepID=A0A814MSV2_9BILA|nr:unnamed protein product [Adineta steineri]CAF1083288.1 unnamed protein product [Adineta steineri]
MATTSEKLLCFTCNEKKITFVCYGCSKRYCLVDLTTHRELLHEEFRNITDRYERIHQWELKLIGKIKKKAQEYRVIVVKLSEICINDIEMKFTDLKEQINQIGEEKEFNDIDVIHFRNKLSELIEESENLSNVFITKDLKSYMNEISTILSKKSKFNEWKQNAITVAGGYGRGRGQKLNRFHGPIGIFIDDKKNIFIANSYNQRIVERKHNANEGQIVVGGNGQENQLTQLYSPCGLSFDHESNIYIADFASNRVQKFDLLISSFHFFS